MGPESKILYFFHFYASFKGPIGASSYRIVCLSCRLFVCLYLILFHRYEVKYFKFECGDSIQTWTVSSSKGCSMTSYGPGVRLGKNPFPLTK